MPDQKKNNTQVLELLKQLVDGSDRMNHQLRSIRHACNFIVVVIVLFFVACVWQLLQFYASTPIEQY